MFEDILYRKKVLGCWLGKAVGGTLGMYTEGKQGPLHLEYYDPIPTSMLPNDDLDLQVVWACSLAKQADSVVSSRNLAAMWLDHVHFAMDEYGVAVRNLKSRILPPFSGSYDNWFVNGMGAAIRSEIWACLAPGDPELAAAFAYEDASVDHAGDGIWAEVFLAALEAEAFVQSDIRKLIDRAKALIPSDCSLFRSIENTLGWYEENPSFAFLFSQITQHYRSDNFTDVCINIPIVVAGLLLGNGDFSSTLCSTVNFGEDTDCTTGMVGAILSIINPDCIEEKWLKPIGRELVVSKEIVGIQAPETLDAFADLICELRSRVRLEKGAVDTFTPQSIKALYTIREYGSPAVPDTPVVFNGHVSRWSEPLPDQHHELLLQYRFHVPRDGKYCIMLNTPAQSETSLNSKVLFHREFNGRMTPSPHRAPWNQSAIVEVSGGVWHTLGVTLQRMPNDAPMEWVLGIADGTDFQWIPEAFESVTFS